MKKFAIMITSVLATLTVSAQETYENARLMETDLNGTARYVAMGGAMDALGADISRYLLILQASVCSATAW